jgi:hypothetical protein
MVSAFKNTALVQLDHVSAALLSQHIVTGGYISFTSIPVKGFASASTICQM